MQKPSVGRVMIAVGAAARGNGADVAPAIVNRVWGDDCVNVTVLPDCAEPRSATSIKVHEDEEAARTSLQNESMTALFWPPRI